MSEKSFFFLAGNNLKHHKWWVSFWFRFKNVPPSCFHISSEWKQAWTETASISKALGSSAAFAVWKLHFKLQSRCLKTSTFENLGTGSVGCRKICFVTSIIIAKLHFFFLTETVKNKSADTYDCILNDRKSTEPDWKWNEIIKSSSEEHPGFQHHPAGEEKPGFSFSFPDEMRH